MGEDRFAVGHVAFAEDDAQTLAAGLSARTVWYARINRTYGPVAVFPNNRRAHDNKESADGVIFFDLTGTVHEARPTSILLRELPDEFNLHNLRSWVTDYCRFHELPPPLQVPGDAPLWRKRRGA